MSLEREKRIKNPVVKKGKEKSTSNSLIRAGGIISVIAAAAGYILSTPSGSDKGGAGPLQEEVHLFEPSKPRAIEREKIPEDLNELIKQFGEVVEKPENYDPSKANFYIIANKHFIPGRLDPDIYKIQEDNVNIFHVLHSLGVKMQFLEGVPAGLDLQHNRPYPQLEEPPLSAMPDYRKSKKIHRAYVAIEGIYGDDVRSVGIEDLQNFIMIRNNFHVADQEDFPKAVFSILSDLAREFKVEYDSDRLQDENYNKEFTSRMMDLTSKLTPEKRFELVKKYVLANPNYLNFLDAAAKWYYVRIQGRNRKYSEAIEKYGGQADAAFIVGAEHAKNLASLLRDRNVFIVKSKNVPKEPLSPFFTNFTEENYRTTILGHDLYILGLGEKPKNSLFEL